MLRHSGPHPVICALHVPGQNLVMLIEFLHQQERGRLNMPGVHDTRTSWSLMGLQCMWG